MKFNSIFLVFCVLICITSAIAGPETIKPRGVFPIRLDEKWGFVDGQGKIVVKPKYRAVDSGGFSEDYIAVLEEGKDGKWGYVNLEGKEVIEPQFDQAHPFVDQKAVVGKDEKYGVIDKKGVFKEVPYRILGDFSCNRAAVQQTVEQTVNDIKRRRTLWGYIDGSGKTIIKPQFMNAGPFSKEGVAIVIADHEYRYINPDGKVLFTVPIEGNDRAPKLSEGLVALKENGRWGYRNAKGEWEIKPQFDSATDFEQGRAHVVQGGRRFHIDRAGAESPPLPFYRLRELKEGLALASRDGLYGYVDGSGQFAFPFKPMEEARDFSCGRAAVRIDGKWGFLDKQGNLAIPCEFASVDDFERGLSWVMKMDGTRGYIDTVGKWVWTEPEAKHAKVPLDADGSARRAFEKYNREALENPESLED